MRRAKSMRAKSRRSSRRSIVRSPSSTPGRSRRSIRPAALASRATNGTRRTRWRNGRTSTALRKAANGLRKAFDPGPAFVSYGAYEMTADGLHVEVDKRARRKTKASEWVSAPFEILGACRDPHGRRLGQVSSLARRRRAGACPARRPTRPCTAIRRRFAPRLPTAACGSIGRSNGPSPTICRARAVAGRVTIVARTGWHEDRRPMGVCPAGRNDRAARRRNRHSRRRGAWSL